MVRKEERRRDLGSKRSRDGHVLVVDSSAAGVSGDMFVGAILGLGADRKTVLDAMYSLKKHLRGCESLQINFERVRTHGFIAIRAENQFKESVSERSDGELLSALQGTFNSSNLSQPARVFARNTLCTLIKTEGKLHYGSRPRSIHLHEAGSIDTLLDIVGTAAGLDDLKLFEKKVQVLCTPIAVGGGTLTFSHGRVSCPAPATLEIARNFGLDIVGGPVSEELATPTGLAILANLVERSVQFYPPMKPLRVGIGAGTKELKGIPNFLRLVLGQKLPTSGKEAKNVRKA